MKTFKTAALSAFLLITGIMLFAGMVFASEGAEGVENARYSTASAAMQEFLDGGRSMTYHENRTEFHFINGKETFTDGEEYTIRELIDKVGIAAESLSGGSNSEKNSSETEIKSVRYAVLDSSSLPLLSVEIDIKQPVLGLNSVLLVMHYDQKNDKIHLALGEDRWTKSSLMINKKGIVTYFASISAFESSYVYWQVTGEGDVNFIYSSYYDNRKASLSDLREREKEICLSTYSISNRPDKYYTLHRLSGGATTLQTGPSCHSHKKRLRICPPPGNS